MAKEEIKIEQSKEETEEVFKPGFESKGEEGGFKSIQEIDSLPFIIDFKNKKIIVQPSTVGANLDFDLNDATGAGGALIQRVITFTNADATPSVKNANVCITTGTTNITDFDDGALGQTIIIKATDNITIVDGASVVLSGGVNYAMTDTDTLLLTMFVDQVWTEVARSVN